MAKGALKMRQILLNRDVMAWLGLEAVALTRLSRARA